MQKPTLLAVMATLLWVGSGFCDEPIQTSKEEKIEKTTTEPEKKNFLNFRAYRPSESILKSPTIDVPLPTIPAPSNPSARTSRENRELLDRQKNWIFVRPGDEKKADATDNPLGVDAMTLDNESKSVLTKFLENKPAESISTWTNANAFNKNDSKKNFGAQIYGPGNDKQNGFGALGQTVTRSENLPVNSNDASLSLAERWQEMHGPGAEKAREDKRMRMNEYENLFGSQNSVTGNGGINPLQSTFGLQPSSSGPGDLNAFSRNAPASSGFRGPVRPIAGANPSTQPSINTRVFGPVSTAAPAPEPPRTVTQPTILPIPKRRF